MIDYSIHIILLGMYLGWLAITLRILRRTPDDEVFKPGILRQIRELAFPTMLLFLHFLFIITSSRWYFHKEEVLLLFLSGFLVVIAGQWYLWRTKYQRRFKTIEAEKIQLEKLLNRVRTEQQKALRARAEMIEEEARHVINANDELGLTHKFRIIRGRMRFRTQRPGSNR